MQDNGLNLALQSAGKDLEQLPRQSKGWLVWNLLLQRQSYWVQCLVLCKRQGAAPSIRDSPLPCWQGRGTISAWTEGPFLLHEHHSTVRIVQHALVMAALALTRSPSNVGKWALKSPLIHVSACYLSISHLHIWRLRVAWLIIWKICTNASQGWFCGAEKKQLMRKGSQSCRM